MKFIGFVVLLVLFAIPICSAQTKDAPADQAKLVESYANTLILQIKQGNYDPQAVENFLQGNLAEIASAAYSQGVDLGKVIRDIRGKHEQAIAEEVTMVNKGEHDKDDPTYHLTEAIRLNFMEIPRETTPNLSNTGITSLQLLKVLLYTEKDKRRRDFWGIGGPELRLAGLGRKEAALGLDGNLDMNYFISVITGKHKDEIQIAITSDGQNGIKLTQDEALYSLWMHYYGLVKKEQQALKHAK